MCVCVFMHMHVCVFVCMHMCVSCETNKGFIKGTTSGEQLIVVGSQYCGQTTPGKYSVVIWNPCVTGFSYAFLTLWCERDMHNQ